MNGDIAGLRTRLNRGVRLRFHDGEVVEATLMGLDPERDHDLTYEVLRVIHGAAPPARGTAPGATIIARIEDLDGWEVLD